MSSKVAHKSHRVGWLRAAVLGGNDGIVSTASLIIGVAAANTNHETILLSGVAGLVAGAMSMAAGEYVSVSSQADTEKADLALEKDSLEKDFEVEKDELAKIYEGRGLEQKLAKEVAQSLMAHDALEAHARDEIGISKNMRAQPVQAAIYSAGSFTIGAALPLVIAWYASMEYLIAAVSLFSLIFLAILGSVAALAGGASLTHGAIRVTFWGALAMGITAIAGKLFTVVI